MNDYTNTKVMTTMRAITKTIGLTLAIVAGIAACASDVDDIDRTQANKVKKELFVGEWYFRPTVIEVQFNQGFLFEGYSGELERVKWEIRKDELVAYRSYELLMGAEEGNGDPDFKGSPVAKFPIQSHFDVIREYNPATGEQSNVLVENTTDRPWYERDYMRVDWGSNTLGNPYKFENSVTAYPNHYVQSFEVDSPHRAEVTSKNINVTGRYMLEADLRTCLARYNDLAWCGQSHALVKLSFMRIEGTRTTPDGLNVVGDYEPLYYPDVVPIRYSDGTPVQTCFVDGSCEKEKLDVFERFGFFRHERLAYDEEFQWTRDGRLFLGHRWNIWRNTHDVNGQVLEPARRQTRAVTYFTNPDFPMPDDPLLDGTEDGDALEYSALLVRDWDMAFRETVAGLQEAQFGAVDPNTLSRIFEMRINDCNRETVDAYADMHDLWGVLGKYGIRTIQKGNLKRACAVLEAATANKKKLETCQPGRLVTFVNNDPAQGLHIGDSMLTLRDDCRFTWQKQGDLRWSFMHWVDTPQASGPLGYGPSAADPVTGEIISATANLYGASVDSYAAYAADLITAMNDPSRLDEIVGGEMIREHVQATRERVYRNYDPMKMDHFRGEMFQRRHEWFGDHIPAAQQGFFNRRMFDGRRVSADEVDDVRAHSVSVDRLDAVKGTPLERELLMNDDIRRAMLGPVGYQPGQPLGEEHADFSPFDYVIGDKAAELHEANMHLAKHSIMMASPSDFSDAGMAALAQDLAGKTWEQVYRFMRREIFRGVQAHEVGHTLGLRHNFQGSFDPLNYHPSFWESYDPSSCAQRDEDGACVRTGAVDRVNGSGPTAAEKYMYSSIMDYDARFYADSLKGIGPYDVAAIKFGYGNLVEVFRPGIAALGYEDFIFLRDYHDIPRMFTGELSCTSVQSCDADFLEADGYYGTYRSADDAADRALENGNLTLWAQKRSEADQAYESYNRYVNTYFLQGLGGATTEACNAANNYCGIWDRQHISFADLQDLWTDYYEGGSYNIPDVVPYKFCPDEVAGYSWVECQPYDKGGTYREVTQDRMERYDSYYYFSNFKRDRFAFNDWSYVNNYLARLYGRTFSQMSNVYRYYLFAFSDMGRDKDGRRLTLADFPVGDDWQKGGIEGLNFLTQVIEQPEPGEYCLESDNVYRPLDDGTTCTAGAGFPWDTYPTTVDVPLGVGKYYYTNWTDEYFYKATRLGTFWDKYAAIFALTDNEGFFYRDFSSFFDVGAFQLSYWSGGLKQELLDIFRTSFRGGTGEYAWRYDDSQTGMAQFRPLPVVDIYDPVDVPDSSLPRFQAASSYTLQWYGVVLPMARFNSGFDYSADYLSYTRICLDGYADCLAFDGSVGTQSYVDPLTGAKYVASVTDHPPVEPPDPDQPSWAIAAEMLKDAQDYADVYVQARSDFRALESSGTATEKEIADARIELERMERKVAEKTALIDIVRDWGAVFGGAWR